MKPTKPSTRSGKPAPTQADALAMLASAVNYYRLAGGEVRAGNTAGGLTLCLPAARLGETDGAAAFVLADTQPTAAPAAAPLEVTAG